MFEIVLLLRPEKSFLTVSVYEATCATGELLCTMFEVDCTESIEKDQR